MQWRGGGLIYTHRKKPPVSRRKVGGSGRHHSLCPLSPRFRNSPVGNPSSSYAFPNPGANPKRRRLEREQGRHSLMESHARWVCCGPLVRKKACSCHPFPNLRLQSPWGLEVLINHSFSAAYLLPSQGARPWETALKNLRFTGSC